MESFQEMPLRDGLSAVLSDIYHFAAPSAVQKEAIEPFVNRENLLVQAPTGSGKTFAYLLPLDTLIDPEKTGIAGYRFGADP